jgi:glycosyltransferase involved in cell wall biosynthesis
MGDSLRTLAEGLPEAARPLLTTRPEAEHRIPDLAGRLVAALDAPRQYAPDLRREAEARFDWRAIAERLAGELEAMANR